jgi:hypothetical protein
MTRTWMTRTWMRPGMVVRRMTPEQIIAAGCGERRLPERRGLPEERGVVCWVQGARNSLSHDGVMAPVVGEVRIRIGSGHYLFTTYTDEWERVPEPEWTTTERVWSANASYAPPDWYEDGDRVSDPDTYEWHLVRALLPPHHAARVFPEDGDWPCDWFELAEAVARCQDFDREADKVSFT